MDPLDPKADPKESGEASAIPTWASGVLRSKAPSEPDLSIAIDRVDIQVDPESGLPYVSVAGFHVVAIEPLTRQGLRDGVHLLIRLCSLQPLDIGALALGAEVRLSATLINQLASRSIMVSRVRVGSAIENAKTAATEYLALRQRAHDHLDRFIESTREAREAGATDAPR